MTDREAHLVELVTDDGVAAGSATVTEAHEWPGRLHRAFSVAHTLAQTGPFRPRNTVRGLDNVALAGCGTTPGVGIPPVLISGRLAAQRLTGAKRPVARARRVPTAG